MLHYCFQKHVLIGSKGPWTRKSIEPQSGLDLPHTFVYSEKKRDWRSCLGQAAAGGSQLIFCWRIEIPKCASVAMICRPITFFPVAVLYWTGRTFGEQTLEPARTSSWSLIRTVLYGLYCTRRNATEVELGFEEKTGCDRVVECTVIPSVYSNARIAEIHISVFVDMRRRRIFCVLVIILNVAFAYLWNLLQKAKKLITEISVVSSWAPWYLSPQPKQISGFPTNLKPNSTASAIYCQTISKARGYSSTTHSFKRKLRD